MNHTNKLVFAVLMFSLGSCPSCTRTAVVPNSDFESLNSSDARVWRMKTTSNELYSVDRFTNTDSSFVIESIIPMKGMDSNGVPYATVKVKELPLVIRYEEIASIEGLYVTDERRIFAYTVFGGTAGILLMIWVASHLAVTS
jgi:hypothetical protein